jgi:hypothetical protein
LDASPEHMMIRYSLDYLCMGVYFFLSDASVLVGKAFQYNPASSVFFLYKFLKFFEEGAASLALSLSPCTEIS